MTTQIKVLRENVIKALSSVKEDNVSIAGVTIHRQPLLAALKLQTQADTLVLTYGNLAWREYHDGCHTPVQIGPEPCLQISCDHTILRFLNRPHVPRHGMLSGSITPLRFVDQAEAAPASAEVTGFAISPRDLLRAIQYVSPALATEHSRPVLECILFEVTQPDTLTLVAADGFRLAQVKLSVKDAPNMRLPVDRSDIDRLVTFLKSIKAEGRGKSRWYPDVLLSVHDNLITVAATDNSVDLPAQTQMVFPDHTRLITTAGTAITFVASELLEAVKAEAIYARDGSGIVRMQFRKGSDTERSTIRVSARSEELGESAVDVEAASVEQDCRIAANSKYLMDVLRQYGDERVTLKVTNPSSPMVFSKDNTLSVVMPMFVQWEPDKPAPEPEPVAERQPDDLPEQEDDGTASEYLDDLESRDIEDAEVTA